MPSIPLFSQRLCVCLLSLPLWGASVATAQEFRVYTSVSEIGPNAESRRVVARSLTLFHAGRVYDHMEEVGELVIFEPVQDRFVLIRDQLATEVSLDELRSMLETARTAAERYAGTLHSRGGAEAAKTCAQLEFQLHPQFTERADPASHRLTLDGGEFRYEVAGSAMTAPDVLATYVEYANWTARMNAVLHSQGTFPGPREALNAALLKHQWLPVAVTLQARDPRDLHLRAEHEFRWQLQPIDRDLIHQWEQLRQSDRMQWVSFREYQHKLLAAAEKSNR